MNGEYLDILILAAVAAFIIFRLRGVLGRRTGNERTPPEAPGAGEKSGSADNVIALADREAKAERGKEKAKSKKALGPLAKGFEAIAGADASFDPENFVAGAKSAFEMIVTSFAMGDLGKIKTFLTKEVYENFSDAVEERLKAEETLETTVVGFQSATISGARMEGRHAFVTVKFVSEQINATRDAESNVVAGDAETPVDVIDIWTFTRDTKSRDPNWALAETSTPE
ncbi:MAG: Tim44/TimA family putative adaptor protein [Alphaproteobacteria bacterium]